MGDVATAFVVVFLAELGDKTQLVALTLGGRYPPLKVLAVLGVAIAILQTLSVTVGVLVAEAVPDRAVAVGAGLLFLGFAVWTWRTATDEDDEVASAPGRAGLISVGVAFFLAELGDKTMLTTAGLAAARGALPVWIGSLRGHAHRHRAGGRSPASRCRATCSPSTLRYFGAIAFAVVGVATLVGAAAS